MLDTASKYKTERARKIAASKTVHGYWGTPTYRAWINMWVRCNDRNNKNYGGRGISVSPNWRSFKNFVEDMGEKPEGLTLERVDTDEGYYPSNCEWATRTAQQNNRRNNIKYGGKTVAQWAKLLGTTRSKVYAKIKKGELPCMD